MKAVVGYINYFDNELKCEIVEVENKNWKEALHNHSAFKEYPINALDWLPSNYYDARVESINAEFDFQVIFLDQ